MNALRPWHLIVLLLVILVVFGSSRLPDVARQLARSMKIFKNELTDGEEKQTGTTTVDGQVVDPGRRPESPIKGDDQR